MSSSVNFSPIQRNKIVENSLDLRIRNKTCRDCLKWGTINTGILAVLMFDISNKCPYAFSNWFYVEYVITGIVALSVIVYFSRYFYYLFSTQPIKGTREQKILLKFDNDSSFVEEKPSAQKQSQELGNSNNGLGLPLNATLLSWHSSFNDSSRMLNSPSWNYNRSTPPRNTPNSSPNISWNSPAQWNSSFNVSSTNNNLSFSSPYKKYSKDEIITDEKSLHQYLQEVSRQQETSTVETSPVQNSLNSSSTNSFWNYCNNAANMLKTSLYQLSPSAVNKQMGKDEGGFYETGGSAYRGETSDSNGSSELLKDVSSNKLSQFVANLRMWIAITIHQRLVSEIKKIDASFKIHNFSDIQIGSIGLERLKKTAENQQFVSQHVPVLPLILPFLEMSTNQEYLVQRIKDLAKGSCLADYRWNSGSSYHGLNWDEHLPTDSAIVFHLFCTYLDSQLRPLPEPEGRPFFNRYVIIGDKKTTKEIIAEFKNKERSCAILCTNQLKPKFNFISRNNTSTKTNENNDNNDKIKIHGCAHDRNNLFYVIIQFFIFMRKFQHGILEGVNLGKSGINILCVIED